MGALLDSLAAQFDQVAQMPGAVGAVLGADEDQMQRLLAAHVGLGAQQQAFGRQRGVEPGEDFVGALETTLQEARRVAALRQCLG